MSNENLDVKQLSDEELDDVAGGAKEKIQCPHCHKMISVNLDKSNIKCPKCGKAI